MSFEVSAGEDDSANNRISVDGITYVSWTTFNEGDEPWENFAPQYSRFKNREAINPLMAARGVGIIPDQPPVDIYGHELPGRDMYIREDIGADTFGSVMFYLQRTYPYTFGFMYTGSNRVEYLPPDQMERVVDEALAANDLAEFLSGQGIA